MLLIMKQDSKRLCKCCPINLFTMLKNILLGNIFSEISNHLSTKCSEAARFKTGTLQSLMKVLLYYKQNDKKAEQMRFNARRQAEFHHKHFPSHLRWSRHINLFFNEKKRLYRAKNIWHCGIWQVLDARESKAIFYIQN